MYSYRLHTNLFISSLVISAVLFFSVQSNAAQVGISMILQPTKTTTVNDAAGQWLYDGGDVIYPEGTVAGHYLRTRRIMFGTSAPQNIAMSTTVLFVDGPIPGNFTLQGAYYFDPAQPNPISGERGSVSAFSDEFAILKNAKYVLTDTGIPGEGQALSLLINQTVDCTDYAYSAWGTCTNGSQSRTVLGYTPFGCIGTPTAASVLTQPCSGPTVILQSGVYHEKTLLPGGLQYYTFTQSRDCTTAMKQLRVLMIELSLSGGNGQLLIKSSNNGKASWLTPADYTYEFGLHGYNNPGQDWTRDPDGGIFFWGFLNGAGGESVSINSSYTGHDTFSQADTYYVLVTNQGSTSNTYRTSFRCY